MQSWKRHAILMAGLFVGGTCLSSIIIPEWAGDENTTSVYYSFPTAANPLVPDSLTNTYGTVQSELVPGTASAGWSNPDIPWHVTRRDGTGAWNINPDGYIDFAIPFSNGNLESDQVEVWVDVIAFVDITRLPEIDVSGTVVEQNVYNYLEEPGLNLGEWRHVAWTGLVEVAGTDTVAVNITGAPTWGSQIDRIAIYTRAIPEPTVISLVLVFAGAAMVGRRLLS